MDQQNRISAPPMGITDVAARLQTLIEANQALARLESLGELLPTLIRLARDITLADGASVMLYDPEKEMLRFEVVEDLELAPAESSALKKTIELKLGQGIAGWVAQNLEPALVNDTQSDPRFFKGADKKSGSTTRNLVCVPLLYQNELLGVVSAVNAKGRDGFQPDDLALMNSFAQLAAVAIIRSRLLDSRLAAQRLEVEQNNAASIQSLFWPSLPGPSHGSHIWAVCEPAGFVGGDTYDLIPMSDGSWLFYVADVTGKGLPAALVVAALSSRFRGEVIHHQQVQNLLCRVNEAMYELLSGEGFFVTMIMGRYWPQSGVMHLGRAGHPLPLWIRDGQVMDMAKHGGLPLGTLADFDCRQVELTLEPGDSILFYSDGMTEAMDARGDFYEHKGLPDFLGDLASPPYGQELAQAVRDWQSGVPPHDDLTILEIWRP